MCIHPKECPFALISEMSDSSFMEIPWSSFVSFRLGRYLILRLISLHTNCNITVASFFLGWLFFSICRKYCVSLQAFALFALIILIGKG